MDFEMPDRSSMEALPEIAADRVRRGDVLFLSKRCPVQSLFWSVGDVWLHSALVVEVDGALLTAEVGTRPVVFSRPLGDVVGAYDLAAIGRPDVSDHCLAGATAWARDQVGADQAYAWDDFLLACLVALTRKGLPAGLVDDLGPVLEEAAAEHEELRRRSRTCAGFVHEAFHRQEGSCSLPIEMTDTRRFSILETMPAGDGATGPTYGDLLELDHHRRQQVLDQVSLYELILAQRERESAQRESAAEAMGGSVISAPQVGRALGTVFDVVAGFLGRDDGESGRLPGCWASPTDLWRSDRLGFRARVGPDI